MKPTLLVMAAGMGSRYGSLKQMDPVGVSGEAIIDYSIYDAVRAGFGKVVFVIRHAFEADFREFFAPERFAGKIEVDFVFQELDNLPEGFTVPEGREKPWGTNHAVMMGRSVIDGPFGAINADDFYGRDAFAVLGDFLRSAEGKDGSYCMVGYDLDKTMSEHGSVSRGICQVDGEGNLTGMVERTKIVHDFGRIVYIDEAGDKHPIDPSAPVSMNMFGFTPDYFGRSEELFKDFITENRDNLKAEFYIPSAVNSLIHSGEATMKVLRTSSQWFGVTYKEDRPGVVARIRGLVDAGEYPASLWK
ncbi:MAG: nucleotidyltransferase [Rikenellaceae bacterium]|nr:nucleotidyltransferase [Rikenellaceae bacterium]